MKNIKRMLSSVMALTLILTMLFAFQPVFADEVENVVIDDEQTVDAGELSVVTIHTEKGESAVTPRDEVTVDEAVAEESVEETVDAETTEDAGVSEEPVDIEEPEAAPVVANVGSQLSIGEGARCDIAGYNWVEIPVTGESVGACVVTLKNLTDFDPIWFALYDDQDNKITDWGYAGYGETKYLLTNTPLYSGRTYYLYVDNDTESDVVNSGSIEVCVSPADLSYYSVLLDDKVYDGTTSIKASANLIYYKYKNGALLQGSAYTVKSNKYAVGPAKVTFTAKAPFSGSKVVSSGFEIYPKPTSISKLYRYKKSFKAKWKAQKTQTTGYQIQYSLKSNMSKAKNVYVNKNSTLTKTVKKLKAKKYYYVRVRTFKKIGTTRYCSSWSSKKKVKTK